MLDVVGGVGVDEDGGGEGDGVAGGVEGVLEGGSCSLDGSVRFQGSR